MKIRKYACLNKNKYCNEHFSLEAIQDTHIEYIRKWRNKKINILRQNKKISKKQQTDYFINNIWNDMNNKFPSNILLSFKINNKLLGYGGLVNISWHNRRSEVSLLIKSEVDESSEKYRQYLNNFFLILKKIAFDELKFKKLTSETFIFRKNHIKILESNGFRNEGKLISQYYQKNKFIDSLLHSCFKNSKQKK